MSGASFMPHKLDTVFDATTAMAAVTVPFWLQDIELWGRALVILGGLVLLVLRILCAWRELRRGGDV
jgi:hypothetical protein